MKVITFGEFMDLREGNHRLIAPSDYRTRNLSQLGVISEKEFLPVDFSDAAKVVMSGRTEPVKQAPYKIPVNLTLQQLKTILDCVKSEAANINFTDVILLHVYPGLLEVRIVDFNGHNCVAWDKLINNGYGPREKLKEARKIEVSLMVDQWKEIMETAKNEIERLRSSDQLYFIVEDSGLEIKIDHLDDCTQVKIWGM